MAARAIEKAVDTLEALAAMRDGRIGSAAVGPGMTESTVYDDLHAAKALLDAGLKIRKMLQSKKTAAAATQGRDLFDNPPKGSPWSFRKAD